MVGVGASRLPVTVGAVESLAGSAYECDGGRRVVRRVRVVKKGGEEKGRGEGHR